MNIICINSRDELNLIDLDKIACIQANGNYSNLMYIEGQKLMISIGLSQFEQIINRAAGDSANESGGNPFVRLGRSVIINKRYLTQISMVKQKLLLSDRGKHAYQLIVPKQTLKAFKDLIRAQYGS
ncbi:MAG: LytTR family transcriptional regulator [Muribaculaceae bacterium]|nr:LytTR family transcriptional regulator [Muribaculaceae bacterium]